MYQRQNHLLNQVHNDLMWFVDLMFLLSNKVVELQLHNLYGGNSLFQSNVWFYGYCYLPPLYLGVGRIAFTKFILAESKKKDVIRILYLKKMG